MEKNKSPRASSRISKSRPSKRKENAKLKANKRWISKNDGTENNASSSAWNETSTSRSYKKLSSFQPKSNQSQSIPECSFLSDAVDPNEFILIHKSVLPNILKPFMCTECSENAITVETIKKMGFAAEIEVQCGSCKTSFAKMLTSPKIGNSKQFLVNKKMVDSFITIGQGHNSLDRSKKLN